MTFPALAAGLIASISLIPSAAGRQLPVSQAEGVIAEARQHVAAGRLAEALRSYEELIGRHKTPAPDLFVEIARRYASLLRSNADPRIRVEACGSLLASGSHPDCVDELRKLATEGAVDIGTRLAAAQTLLERRVAGANALLDTVVAMALLAPPAAAADALAQLPPATSTEPLKRLAMGDDRDARYIATLALARQRTSDVAPILRAIAADRDAGAARLVAYIGLAARGDADGLRVVRETLPLIKGRERLEAGLALAAVNDPEGLRIVQSLLAGEHELQRLDAAGTLFSAHPELASPILLTGVRSTNPWVRARAIRVMAAVGLPTTPDVRLGMADKNPVVAIAAVRAAIEEAGRR